MSDGYSTHKDDFDLTRFVEAVDLARKVLQLDWIDVKIATGVSTTTLSRMQQGRKPDAASLAALSAWASINPANYMARKAKAVKLRPPEVLLKTERNMEADRHEDDTDNWW